MLLADLLASANDGDCHVGSSRRRRKGLRRSSGRGKAQQCCRLAPALLLLGLVACSEPGVEPDQATQAAPYPELATVPPRPRLSYTLAQRRQIADALVSDRENARYDRAVTRYELGLDELPPPESRPPTVEEPEPAPGGVPVLPDQTAPRELVPGGGALAEALVTQQLLTERDYGELRNFLRVLERQRKLDQQLSEAGLSRGSDPWPDDLPGVPPAPPPTVEPPADAVTVQFEPGSSAPSIEAEAALRAKLAEARSAERRLAVVGHGASRSLSEERARAVAKWLMQLGAPADMLAVQGGGAGERVLVYELPA